jgi:23S rRNA pseudouridine1911/1915/1917 synthase
MSDRARQEFTVTDDQVGMRLDALLSDLLGVSRSAAARRIDAGDVRVDGRAARRSRTLAAAEVVQVDAAPEDVLIEAPELPPVRHRDEHLLVLAKPAGLVVHAGHGHRGDTLVDALQAAGVPLAPGGDADRPGIVHRLDRDTSGLLLVASTPEALTGLVGMLAERTITRRYLALLVGEPPAVRGVVDAPIGRHPVRRTRFAVVDDGRPARTRYRVLGSGSVEPTATGGTRAVSSVVCGLESGRTHQIRVHLDAVGAPVAGDPVYGTDRGVAEALGLDRPALHAAHLSFIHPVTGEELSFTEPLPDELARAWAAAGIDVPTGDEEP